MRRLFCFQGVTIALKIFADYKDSPDAIYLIAGGLFTVLGVILITTAALLSFYSSSRTPWLILAVALFLAGLVPYDRLFGPMTGALNIIFLALAAVTFVIFYVNRQRRRANEGAGRGDVG